MTAEEMWRAYGGGGTAWAFGAAPDLLAELVMDGKKRATCTEKAAFDFGVEVMPAAGDYSVILDSGDNAVCIIRSTTIHETTFTAVTAEHARKEGEGDRSLEYWCEVHKHFFTAELEKFSP